jgi:hypothetical protein
VARSDSGKIVVSIDPDLKNRLHALLAYRNLTMKDWITRQAELFIEEISQPGLFSSIAYRGSGGTEH